MNTANRELLLEGMAMRSVCRMTEMSFTPVQKLLVDAGSVSAAHHDANVRNLKARHVRCDEIWSFVYAKRAHLNDVHGAPPSAGDAWIGTVLDVDTKFALSCLVEGRSIPFAKIFMHDLASPSRRRVASSSPPTPSCPIRRPSRRSPARGGLRHHRDGGRRQQFRGAPEPDHAHAHEALHLGHERFLQEVREPLPHGGAVRDALTTSARSTARCASRRPWRPASPIRLTT